jgi:hypothetical protein
MTVRTADRAWASFADDRAKVAALMGGRETSKAYIRALPGHNTATQTKFADGAYFLPMTARSAEAFGGLVFAKAPTRAIPAALDPILTDLTRTGQDVDRFAEMAFDAVLETYAICVVIDYPQTPGGMTKKEAEDRGIRPFATLYDGKTILAARFSGDGDARQLGHVRLLETVEEPDPADEWAVVSVEQVRVLDLDEAGFYRQRIYRRVENTNAADTWEQYGETIEPKMANARMSVIPAFFSNPRDAEPRPGVPPLRDIADVNIAHLNDSAAYQWGILWTANPTPVFIGFNFKEGDTVSLGSAGGLTSDNPVAKAAFMEFTGSGLSELRASMEAKRRDGAMMGARLLMEESKAAIAAETARIQRAGETSVIAGIANAVSECLTKALTFLAQWAGIEPKVVDGANGSAPLYYWLNTDLNPAGLSSQDIMALLAAWQAGGISEQELFACLQAGEVIDPAKSFEDHKEERDAEGMALGVMGGNDDGMDPEDATEAADAPTDAAEAVDA